MKFYINKYIIETESNDNLKEIDIKNRTCYYFDDVVKIKDFDLDKLLIDEKSYEKMLVYNIPHKNLISTKPFCIRFNKINGMISFMTELDI